MVSLWIFPKRFLARSKQILWRFARGVNRQIPPSPRRYGGQTEIDRIGAGIEHQVPKGKGTPIRTSVRSETSATQSCSGRSAVFALAARASDFLGAWPDDTGDIRPFGCRILFGLFASCIGAFCFIPLPFEIESPLPQDVSGFQRNRNAGAVR